MSDNIIENGVHISSKAGKPKTYNRRLQIIREATLAVLDADCKSRQPVKPIQCLDVSSVTGISGIQWKKHLQDLIHVTLADKDNMEDVQQNCELNGVSFKKLPLDFDRIPGDPIEAQASNEVHTCKCEPHVLLHMESFDFIYVNPHGDLINHIEPVMSHIYHNGILCLVSADSSHQFARTTNSIKRHYGATVMKTEYLKELACRTIIGTIARIAASCNRGIHILFSMYVEDVFLLVIRVLRGPKQADQSTESLQKLLHCQMCQERVFIANSLAPVEKPYKLLPCSCHNDTPGKTGAVLGPLWSGSIFDTQFLQNTLHSAKAMSLSKKLKKLICTMLEETGFPSLCERCYSNDCECCNGNNKQNITESVEDGKKEEPAVKRLKMDPCLDINILKCPPFYYNLHRLHLKELNLPKAEKIIAIVREEGYIVTRTHFEPHGLRTNALLSNLKEILTKKLSLIQDQVK